MSGSDEAKNTSSIPREKSVNFSPDSKNLIILGFIAILLLLIFYYDSTTPFDAAVWALYILPLVTSIWARQRWMPFAVAGASVSLITAGAILSLPINGSYYGVFNRALYCIILVLAAFGIWSHKRGDDTQRENERRLKESEERYRVLVDSAPDAVVVHRDGRILYANSAALQMIGAPTFEELRTKNFKEFFLPHDRDENETRAQQGGQSLPLHDTEILRLDGRIIPVESIEGTVAYQGEPAIQSIIRDITERKKAEEDIYSIALFPMQNPSPVMRADEKGVLIYANDASGRLLDSWNTHVHDPLPLRIGGLVRESLNEGSLKTIDETLGQTTYSVVISPIRDQRYVNMYFTDISERKRTEEALLEASQYLENLIAYANAPIIVWDSQFRITRFNRAFERLTGRKASDVTGQRLDILFPDETRDKSMTLIRQTFFGERWEVVEIPIIHVDGSVRTVLWNSATLYDKGGETVLSTIAQGQDITKMKQHEEDLMKAMEDLRRSNKELEQFAYVASHDLREPLRMVTSFSQLLEQRYRGKLDADADEFIHYIVEGGTRMDLLVNDLLEYSRVTSRANPFEPTDMNAVVRGVIRDLSVAVRECGADIDVDMLPKVSVDRSQLTQVFQNLISNAVKFRGGDEPKIRIGATRFENEWVFSVEDNGIGIAPEYSEKIFEIFQRLHKRSEYEGTGIGLAICRRIIERHGGRIWVESTEGEGSTFFFTIPVIEKSGDPSS